MPLGADCHLTRLLVVRDDGCGATHDQNHKDEPRDQLAELRVGGVGWGGVGGVEAGRDDMR